MRIGILTGGGDCPGLNAVIRAVTRRALDRDCEVVGVLVGGAVGSTARTDVWSDLPLRQQP